MMSEMPTGQPARLGEDGEQTSEPTNAILAGLPADLRDTLPAGQTPVRDYTLSPSILAGLSPDLREDG